MSEYKYLKPPLKDEDVLKMKAGDRVLITGYILTGRDAAHKRLYEILIKGESLPIDLEGQILYYVGPTPPKPGYVIGSAGPTTSGRMDLYTPKLHEVGLKATIGKGQRSKEVKEAMKKYKALYLLAVGGAGALLAKRIKKVEVILYEDLGPEAIRRLYVEDFPAIVVNDAYGGDLFEEGKLKYRKTN